MEFGIDRKKDEFWFAYTREEDAELRRRAATLTDVEIFPDHGHKPFGTYAPFVCIVIPAGNPSFDDLRKTAKRIF